VRTEEQLGNLLQELAISCLNRVREGLINSASYSDLTFDSFMTTCVWRDGHCCLQPTRMHLTTTDSGRGLPCLRCMAMTELL
jgi:hypothetical protein